MLQSSYRTRKRIRLGLVFLGLPQLVVGIWALVSARSFYRDFPFGRAWVSPLGEFNEHLIIDVGALFCALAVVALFGAVRVERRLSQAAALAWIVYVVPHLFWHASNTGPFSLLDNAVQLGAFAVQLLIALYVLSAARRLKA